MRRVAKRSYVRSWMRDVKPSVGPARRAYMAWSLAHVNDYDAGLEFWQIFKAGYAAGRRAKGERR